MLKVKKSFLMICLISLFLLISQAAAADFDSIGLDDSNANSDSIEITDVDANTDSINLNDLKSDSDSFDTEINDVETDAIASGNAQKSIDLEEEAIFDGINNIDDSAEVIDEEQTKTDIVMVDDDYSCGAASLATVLNRLGIEISLSDAKTLANTTSNGTTMEGIINAAKKCNLEAYGVYANASDLKENFIVHMNISGVEHWSVVDGIVDNKILLADSSLGPIEYDLEDFKKVYTNQAVIIFNQSEITDLNMSKYVPLSNHNLTVISGKGVAYSWCKKLSYIKDRVNPGYAFEVHVVVPKWGGNTVRVTTKKITPHMICCNVVYKITYYKKPNYKGKAYTVNYPCIFNLAMKKGKTVTVNLPTYGIQSFRFTVTVCKFP